MNEIICDDDFKIECIEEKPQGLDLIRALIAIDIRQFQMSKITFIFDEKPKSE